MRDKPYCKAPWIGLSYTGTEGCKPCCEWKGRFFGGTYKEYIKSDYLKDFKAMMYNDEMHSDCMECIHNEKIELISRRQKFMKYDIGDGLVRLDYRPGNKCNMKCRMCGAHSSSLWEDENIKYYGPSHSIPKIDTSDVYDIDFSNLDKIMILGGEPSVDLEVRKFIDWVSQITHCPIGITTNATNSSDKWFNTIKKIKKLELTLSIDGTGAIQEYQRKGGEWSKIKENIIKYRDTFKNTQIQLTATAINFPVLDRWWDELINLNLPIYFGVVHYPINQNLDAIPDDFKEEQIFWLDNWLKLLGDEPDFGHMNPLSNEEIEIFVTWKQKRDSAEEAKVILGASKYNDNYSKQFYERTIELDNIRDESIYDVDPRFKEIMKVGRHQNYTLSQPEGIGDPHSYEG
jgi:MoaA/NifB/PqqE/SkfB family radical SAM enzyme